MLGFEQTANGYTATNDQVAWWKSRDTCPGCGSICEPVRTSPLAPGATVGYKLNHYVHECDGDRVEWTRRA